MLVFKSSKRHTRLSKRNTKKKLMKSDTSTSKVALSLYTQQFQRANGRMKGLGLPIECSCQTKHKTASKGPGDISKFHFMDIGILHLKIFVAASGDQIYM